MGRLDWLFDRFKADLSRVFMIWDDDFYSYDWLLKNCQQWQSRLDKDGLLSGEVVAIEGDYTPEVVAVLLALIEKGSIIVPMTAAVLKTHQSEFMRIAEVGTVISFLRSDEGQIIQVQREVQNPLTQRLIRERDPGLVLFSSGSTGRNKAALHNFSVLMEKFKKQRQTYRTLMLLLFDHIGGINTLFYVLSNAGTMISIHKHDPDHVCAAVEKHHVELMPTSPTFLNLLLISEAYNRYDLSSLQRVTYGTEIMPASTLRRLREILPWVDFQQTYGLTEVGILRSKSQGSDSLWVKVGGEDYETKIENGTLWIRAQTAMLGYLNEASPFDADGWFNTGDVVEVRGDYIKIVGRQSDIINVGGQKVYPAEVEDVLLQMENVRDVAVFGEPNSIMGHVVAARFNLHQDEDIARLKRRLREFCRTRLPSYKVPIKIEIRTDDQYNWRLKKVRNL